MSLFWKRSCSCGDRYGTHGDAPITNCDGDGDVTNGLADICGNGRSQAGEDCFHESAVYTVDGLGISVWSLECMMFVDAQAVAHSKSSPT